MGRLVEGSIPQIFNGVSRQPHSVRFPGQVENASNVTFSVETGGFSKRLGTRLKKKIAGLTTGQNRKLHIINRDAAERYRLVLSNGGIRIFDEDYVEKTVNVDASNTTWLSTDPSNFTMVTALDYTFIAKKTTTVAMSSTVAADAPSMYVLYVAAVPDISAAVTYEVKVGGVVKATYSANISSDTTTTIATQLRSLLATNLGAGWTVTRSGSFVFVRDTANAAHTISTEAPRGDTSLLSYGNTVADTSRAPARALHGMMLNVKGTVGTGFWIKFVAQNSTSGEGYWVEAAAPGTQTTFNATTMPRAIIRNADGSFTLQTLTWNVKSIGGEDDVPPPEFVGETIRDLVFIRNRLGIVAGETTYFSKAGDYFNFWPNSATELLDDDPFGLTNTTNSVSRFFFAVPFRRSVFIMGDNAQFEIGGTALTPTLASIDLATSYAASTTCRPVAVGDELYFPAESGSVASIMSYVYEESSVSEVASDVSKHIEGYLPSPVVEMAGDPIRGQLYVLSGSTRTSLYIYKFYYQGEERVQSAWFKYQFNCTVRSMGVVDGVVNLLVELGSDVWLIELPTQSDVYTDYSWVPRLDVHQFLTGTYDSTLDRTTWTLGYTPTSPKVITSNLFPLNSRMLSLPLTISGQTVYATGNWSAFPAMVGETFDASVELSKQFLRDGNGTTIINGRLQLRRMALRYTDTGYFTVEVTPDNRDVETWTYSGRTVSAPNNQIQRLSISSGTYRFTVGSNGETAKIVIRSNGFMPMTITSGSWIGFFNETTRQG